MVNAPKMNLSPLPAGKYGKSTKSSTRWHPEANEGKSGLEAERVQALGELRSLRSKKKPVAGTWPETHILSNEEKVKLIKDYVERETTEARKGVEDAETAIKQLQDDMRNADKAGLTTTKPETTFEEILNAIGDSLSDFASSDDGEDGEDEDDDKEDAVGGKVSEDDKPGWVMGTISKAVQYRMERVRQKQKMLDQVMQPRWGDTAYYFCGRDTKYGMTEWNVPAVDQTHTANDAMSSALTSCGEPMETLDSVPGELQQPQVISQQGSSHMKLGSWKPQTHKRIPSLPAAPIPNSSSIQKSQHVGPISLNPCILSPKLITIQKSDSDQDMVTAPVPPEEWIRKLAYVMIYQFEM